MNYNSTYVAEIKAELDELAALVEPVVGLLGDGWTAKIYQNRIIELVCLGGYANPDGFKLHARSEGYNKSRATWTKFNFSGNYPQPDRHEDRYSPIDAPTACIDLKNTKSAASQINRRLVPGVKEHTALARQNQLDSQRTRANFLTNAIRVAHIMRSKRVPTANQLGDSFRESGSHGNHYISADLRESGRVELKISGLSVAELELVVSYISKLD